MFEFVARWRRAMVPLLLCTLLFVTGCAAKTSPYAQAQKDSTRWGAPSAVAKKAEQGATFNKFFPNGVRGYEIVPAQEKKGFAEYKVNRDGKNVAVLSISDTTSVPAAAAKYQASTFKVGSYPAVDQGTTTTGILVNDRYQVKVASRDPSFTKDDRLAWLQKFDLKGIAQLKATPASSVAEVKKLPPSSTSKAPVLPSKRPVLTPQPAA
jgi:hypothetical protein